MAKSKKNSSPKTRATHSTENANPNQSEMKTSEIRDLIDFISQSGLNEVNIETNELKLHVKRKPDQKIFKATPVQASTPLPAVAPVTAAPSAKTEKPAAPGDKTAEIKSPMIGTFYRTANPDSPPFVSVGDKITKGQTVCIIEAMKLFNEIESEVSGTIIKVMVENASPVEYDQALFVVEPD
jgi:acetyl-CoA carboxylase biotin carboxyl carrier protein